MNARTAAAPRWESGVLVGILLTVAGFAGAASFTHVKDWTLDNSPSGTGVWFGWANAVISELIPVAALLVIRRRRRTGQPIGYPLLLLVAAACLSLAAQLAVAKPSASGWLLSAVPALAFMALAKLVLAPPPAGKLPPTADSVPTAADDDQVSTSVPPTRPDASTRPTDLVPVAPEAFNRLNGVPNANRTGAAQ